MVGVRNRTRRVICRSVRFALAVRGGVLDAPRSRDCRGGLVASVRPDRQHPRHTRRADIASTAQRIQIPRAQPAHLFKRAHPRYPSTKAGWAWKPAPTACWVGIRSSPTPPSTPQSRRFGPCQLPFPGSREGVYGRTHVIRHPTPGGRRLYRLRGLASLTRMGGLYAPWGVCFPRGRGLCPRAWPWPRPRSAGCRWGGRRRK